ncbi:MAG: hypothetical protein WDM76_17015 [Limisphaerales bacterium]
MSYQWLFNSNAIAGATGTNYTIADAQATNSGSYQVVVSNTFSTVVSPIAHLNVFAGSITQDMVVHLTFDNTYADTSGRGNNATNVGAPTFEPGFLGQAVRVVSSGSPANAPATNNYVTLGYPGDLAFGSDPNASISPSHSGRKSISRMMTSLSSATKTGTAGQSRLGSGHQRQRDEMELS